MDLAPPYEESVGDTSCDLKTTWTPWASPTPLVGEQSASGGRPSVLSTMKEERTRRIQSVIDSHVIPHVSSRLADAVGQMTILVIPPGSLPDMYTKRHATNVVAPSFQYLPTEALIVLSGDGDRAAFWTQPVVVEELQAQLTESLRRLLGPVPQPESTGAPQESGSPFDSGHTPPSTLGSPERSRGMSWRKSGLGRGRKQSHDDPTGKTGAWEVNWRSPSPDTRVRRSGECTVRTELEDISLRAETEMGLLETTTVRGIRVQVAVGLS